MAMSKAEAEAVREAATRAFQHLSTKPDWSRMTIETKEEVWKHHAIACDELQRILNMANAVLK